MGGEGKIMRRGGGKEEAAQPCVPGVRSVWIKALSLRLPFPTACFLIHYHSLPLCVNIVSFWTFKWPPLPRSPCVNWIRLDCEYWRVTSWLSQGRSCCHGYSKAFHFKAVRACVHMPACQYIAHRHDMISVWGGWSPSFSVHHVLFMRAKPSPANPGGVMLYCSLLACS